MTTRAPLPLKTMGSDDGINQQQVQGGAVAGGAGGLWAGQGGPQPYQAGQQMQAGAVAGGAGELWAAQVQQQLVPLQGPMYPSQREQQFYDALPPLLQQQYLALHPPPLQPQSLSPIHLVPGLQPQPGRSPPSDIIASMTQNLKKGQAFVYGCVYDN